jgi:hypothetical protein
MISKSRIVLSSDLKGTIRIKFDPWNSFLQSDPICSVLKLVQIQVQSNLWV